MLRSGSRCKVWIHLQALHSELYPSRQVNRVGLPSQFPGPVSTPSITVPRFVGCLVSEVLHVSNQMVRSKFDLGVMRSDVQNRESLTS